MVSSLVQINVRPAAKHFLLLLRNWPKKPIPDLL